MFLKYESTEIDRSITHQQKLTVILVGDGPQGLYNYRSTIEDKHAKWVL